MTQNKFPGMKVLASFLILPFLFTQIPIIQAAEDHAAVINENSVPTAPVRAGYVPPKRAEMPPQDPASDFLNKSIDLKKPERPDYRPEDRQTFEHADVLRYIDQLAVSFSKNLLDRATNQEEAKVVVNQLKVFVQSHRIEISDSELLRVLKEAASNSLNAHQYPESLRGSSAAFNAEFGKLINQRIYLDGLNQVYNRFPITDNLSDAQFTAQLDAWQAIEEKRFNNPIYGVQQIVVSFDAAVKHYSDAIHQLSDEKLAKLTGIKLDNKVPPSVRHEDFIKKVADKRSVISKDIIYARMSAWGVWKMNPNTPNALQNGSSYSICTAAGSQFCKNGHMATLPNGTTVFVVDENPTDGGPYPIVRYLPPASPNLSDWDIIEPHQNGIDGMASGGFSPYSRICGDPSHPSTCPLDVLDDPSTVWAYDQTYNELGELDSFYSNPNGTNWFLERVEDLGWHPETNNGWNSPQESGIYQFDYYSGLMRFQMIGAERVKALALYQASKVSTLQLQQIANLENNGGYNQITLNGLEYTVFEEAGRDAFDVELNLETENFRIQKQYFDRLFSITQQYMENIINKSKDLYVSLDKIDIARLKTYDGIIAKLKNGDPSARIYAAELKMRRDIYQNALNNAVNRRVMIEKLVRSDFEASKQVFKMRVDLYGPAKEVEVNNTAKQAHNAAAEYARCYWSNWSSNWQQNNTQACSGKAEAFGNAIQTWQDVVKKRDEAINAGNEKIETYNYKAVFGNLNEYNCGNRDAVLGTPACTGGAAKTSLRTDYPMILAGSVTHDEFGHPILSGPAAKIPSDIGQIVALVKGKLKSSDLLKPDDYATGFEWIHDLVDNADGENPGINLYIDMKQLFVNKIGFLEVGPNPNAVTRAPKEPVEGVDYIWIDSSFEPVTIRDPYRATSGPVVERYLTILKVIEELKHAQQPFSISVSTNPDGNKNLTVSVDRKGNAKITWNSVTREGKFDPTSGIIVLEDNENGKWTLSLKKQDGNYYLESFKIEKKSGTAVNSYLYTFLPAGMLTTFTFEDNEVKQTTRFGITRFGITGNWIEITTKSPVPQYTAQLHERINGAETGRIFIAVNLNSDFTDSVQTQFLVQRELKGVTRFWVTGDWMEITSNLTNAFKITAVTQYFMQLQEKTAGAETGRVFITANLNSDFTEALGATEFFIQRQMKNVARFGIIGDWVESTTSLNNKFQVTADTEYTMQLLEKYQGAETGVVFLATNLSSAFGETSISEFLKKRELRFTTRFGMTGDWMELTTNLTNTFSVTADTQHSMVLSEEIRGVETGAIFKAEGLDSSFSETTTSKFSKERQLFNVTRFGKTGDWIEITSGLGHNFDVNENTKYSMKLWEKLGGVETGNILIATNLTPWFSQTPETELITEHGDKSSANKGSVRGIFIVGGALRIFPEIVSFMIQIHKTVKDFDCNHDGIVDIADYTILRDRGASSEDLALWKSFYGMKA